MIREGPKGNPKSEVRKKCEIRNPNFGLSPSGFVRVSDFTQAFYG